MRAAVIVLCIGAFLIPGSAIAAPPANQDHDPVAAIGCELERSLDDDPSLHGITAAVSGGLPGHATMEVARGRVSPEGDDLLASTDTFRIASVTKVFVAATILRLHEQGKLDVFSTIDNLIDPEIGNALARAGYDPGRMTIYQLMTHSSGLRDYAESASYRAAVAANPSRVWTPREQIDVALGNGGPLAAPGAIYAYSDTNYVILADIIERMTGRPIAAAVRQELAFDRLGLEHTYWERFEPAPRGIRRAGQRMGTIDVTVIDPSVDLFGGGGLVSSAGDIAIFFRALMRGDLFEKPETLTLGMMPPLVLGEDSRPRAHAPLMRVTKVGAAYCWGHGGYWGVEAIYCPSKDVAVVVAYLQVTPGPMTKGVGNRLSIIERVADLVTK